MLKTYQKLRLLNNVSILRHVCYSTQPIPRETTDHEDQLKEFQKISNIQQKTRTKKPQKPPFVKNLLLGIFDTDLLTYPELTNEELNNLNKNVEQAQSFLQQPEIREHGKVTKQFLKRMASGRLLGLQSSQLMGGRELFTTELCRFFELISELGPKNSLINNESLGVQTLVKFGSEHLKRKYLQKLIDGESLSAFCVVEPLPSKVTIFKTAASKSGDGKSWVLNGQRKLVMNGSDADFYVVVANTEYVIRDELREQKYTVFVVERDCGGITSFKQKTIDENVELSDVIFENTPIPSENVIGIENTGDSILNAIYPEHRLSTGSLCSVLLRSLINNVTQYFIDISKEPNFLHEADAIRIKLGEIASSAYALDSMVYLTSGLIDNYEGQDTELETAIVKVFGSEQAFLATSSCIDLIGAEANLDKHWCGQLHKEALCQVTLNDSNDNLKILIALFGLRHAGQGLNELVKKLRNPLFYSTLIFKRLWTQRRQDNDNPKLDLYLHYNLHPSCLSAAKRLEYSVLRLQYAVELLLARHGPEIVNRHADLTRVAECVIDIYAMTASIARASRSYCIGLQHCDYEMTFSNTFTINAAKRVKSKLQMIIEGHLGTADDKFRSVSERLFQLKKYYPVHPLTRNF